MKDGNILISLKTTEYHITWNINKGDIYRVINHGGRDSSLVIITDLKHMKNLVNKPALHYKNDFISPSINEIL